MNGPPPAGEQRRGVSVERFVSTLLESGRRTFFGVPCSFLRPLIDHVAARRELSYFGATNEGEALALAAGAFLAGGRPVVMLQNSGLGNLVNPLASLTYTFRIPVLLMVTLRGEPGLGDEPQHELMGRTTAELLRVLEVRTERFPECDDDVSAAIARAEAHMAESGLPFAFLVGKGGVRGADAAPPLDAPVRPSGRLLPDAGSGPLPTRREAIAAVADTVDPRTLLVATTGKTGRELFEHRDRDGNLYVVGSMGLASSIALGVALHDNSGAVVVLDGDGAALMRMEAFASIGHARPPAFVHVLLDNRAHDSTGGQPTLSGSVDFPALAIACGYASAVSVTGAAALAREVARASRERGPHLLHAPIALGSRPDLGRPGLAPPDVAHRLQAWLARGREDSA
jgi:phosphonopyruvate decarboxylase